MEVWLAALYALLRVDMAWACRLALALANCQLQMLGQKTHTCSEATPLQKCTESFPDDRSYNTFTEQLAQIDRCWGTEASLHLLPSWR